MNVDNKEMDFPNEFVKATVKEIADSEKIVDTDTVVSQGSNFGDNYFGKLYKIQVSGSKHGNTSILNLVYKMAPIAAAQVESQIFLMYDREILMYEIILKKLNEIQEYENILNLGKLRFAKCYKVIKDNENKAIVMEDVAAVGFKMRNRLESLDWHHVRVVLENLSRLHGLSYILKSRYPDTFSKFKESTVELFYNEHQNKESAFFCKNGVHESLFAKALMTVKDQGLAQRLAKWTDEKRNECMCRLSSHKVDTAVICHGDSWTNNYMFKHNEVGDAFELCFIDWQYVKYASPMTDIMYMLSASTDGPFRAKHYDHVFEYYYSCLSSYLKLFDMDVEEFYPKRTFFEDKHEYAPYGLFWGFIFLGVTTGGEGDVNNAVSTEDIVTIDKGNFLERNSNDTYVNRINELVEDFASYGCI